MLEAKTEESVLQVGIFFIHQRNWNRIVQKCCKCGSQFHWFHCHCVQFLDEISQREICKKHLFAKLKWSIESPLNFCQHFYVALKTLMPPQWQVFFQPVFFVARNFEIKLCHFRLSYFAIVCKNLYFCHKSYWSYQLVL